VLLVSFWPSSHGHWSALVLAIPGLLAGLLLFVVFAGPHADLPVKLGASVPALLAIGSFVLWFRKRKARREQISNDNSVEPRMDTDEHG
jgi:hypothetical protein